ncbi:unnamed protein product [Staurois parvus]|uniref:Uncharacterized protein n=1 Tax=Staurois parvus TaxID=386267 RepID=A0ABN9G9P3_9NEOB|nr:unnamed protein product [Staurois parvus]
MRLHNPWTVQIYPVPCTLLRKRHQTEHVQSVPEAVFYQEMKWGM